MEKREQLDNQIKRLKQTRLDLGMNRTEFSQYMGIPLRTLEEWEAGRRMMPDYQIRILTAADKIAYIKEKNNFNKT